MDLVAVFKGIQVLQNWTHPPMIKHHGRNHNQDKKMHRACEVPPVFSL